MIQLRYEKAEIFLKVLWTILSNRIKGYHLNVIVSFTIAILFIFLF